MDMSAMKTKFSRKLHVAFGAMLAITLALAWYFYDSVQWFEYDVERITIANSVLNAHRTLSAETTRKLSLIDESVASGHIADLPRWHDNIRVIRSSIVAIRQALADENALRRMDRETGEMEVLDEMESFVEIIIISGEVIRKALEEQRLEDARGEMEALKSSGTAGIFNQLMLEALSTRGKQLSEANAETISLAHYITGVLPLFMLTLAGLTAVIAWLFSRSLTRSVNVLHHGAKAFTSGDLNHRIPELQEKEFENLGVAFNTMARQLADHRTGLRDSNVRLEAIVEERTRALKRSNEILEMVDENRRKLLADISHEFRTPLTVIRGESEIALRGKAKTKAEYQETLARIMEQAEQTTRLVDDLLFIARADAGESRLKVRPVSVSSLLGASCSDFKAKAEQKEITIVQDFEGVNVVAMGDSGRLRQVFSILIDNALRYSKDGGKVEVRLQRDAKNIIVLIRDNGIGLTKEESRQAFQRFFRGGNAQGHARGTGLGLSVAKAIVEAHKGTITLEGKAGKGALATVMLPAEDKLKAVA
ncbi:MAG: HAMP domain-containing protein [Xanthomonadales bacterium]|nr:HAMP domain-containing protein [Xanthomonadales bacterium]